MSGPGRHGPECGIKRAVQDMDENDRETARMVLPDDGYKHMDLVEAFNEILGEERLTIGQIKHHRQGKCRCHRDKEDEDG